MEPQQRRQARQSPPSLLREFVENASPLKKGPWTAEEDALLLAYVSQHGNGNWNTVQKYSGVSRCGKSCRLRWTNHLRPHLKKGSLTQQEERIIIEQHAAIGNRWSKIANMLQGRTDNEVKNFWNTRMKRLLRAGQPLYPPDVIPIARARSQQRESEHSADERAVSLCLSGDVPGDSSTVANSLKSVSTSIQNQKIVNGEQFPVEVSPKASQAYLAIAGSRTPNNKVVDESGFLLTNGNIIPSLSSYENAVTGLKRPRELPLNDMLQNTVGGPFYHFSSTNMSLQQERKVRCMYDPNLGRSEFFYQGFPYDPEPPDRKLSTYDLSMGGVSLGIAFGDMGNKLSITPTACNFSTSVHEAQCLKVELPSVQLAESADSSSSLSSPFSASQSLPLSEVDSFGSTSNECTPKNCGKLFDVLVQQNGSSPNVLSADMVEQLLVVNSNNTSPRNTVPLSFQSSTRVASSDPLALLGGRSLTLFGDDFKATSENSSSNEDPLLAFQRAEEKDNSNSKVSDDALPLINIKTEEQSSGLYADEELYMLLAFEKPDGYAVADLYEERAQLAAVSNRQELMGHPGGLDAIFGHNNGSLDLEQLATMSGIGNIWELGSCAWNSMPGAL